MSEFTRTDAVLLLVLGYCARHHAAPTVGDVFAAWDAMERTAPTYLELRDGLARLARAGWIARSPATDLAGGPGGALTEAGVTLYAAATAPSGPPWESVDRMEQILSATPRALREQDAHLPDPTPLTWSRYAEGWRAYYGGEAPHALSEEGGEPLRVPATAHFPIPVTLRTGRLLLRPWKATDAPALLPVLEANLAHLAPWIPAHVFTPVPLHELEERLAGFAADFAADRAYRYALLAPDGARVCGEADLFPRDATGRVPLAHADRVELGYWLDAAVTGQGLATEATDALLAIAESLPGMSHAEIRCDPANAASAAVPRRLGFRLAAEEADTQLWRKELAGAPGEGGRSGAARS